MTVTVNGTNGLTFADASTQNTAATGFGFKNRIINGEMKIAQRGTSFATPGNGTYTLDRWSLGWAGASPASIAQVAGSGAFKNALQITGNAGNTSCYVFQRIESYNCSDLSGATVTLQANIAVSSAQTVLWELFYPSGQDNWGSYTVFAVGTWSATTTATTFTATITGLPANVVNGLMVLISPQNATGFTSGTITITGVQLEKGSTATSFDYRPYGTELALCQRYYETGNFNFTGYQTTGNGYGQRHVFAVVKRTTPTMTTSGVTSINVTTLTLAGFVDAFYNNGTATATGAVVFAGNYQASAEL